MGVTCRFSSVLNMCSDLPVSCHVHVPAWLADHCCQCVMHQVAMNGTGSDLKDGPLSSQVDVDSNTDISLTIVSDTKVPLLTDTKEQSQAKPTFPNDDGGFVIRSNGYDV